MQSRFPPCNLSRLIFTTDPNDAKLSKIEEDYDNEEFDFDGAYIALSTYIKAVMRR